MIDLTNRLHMARLLHFLSLPKAVWLPIALIITPLLIRPTVRTTFFRSFISPPPCYTPLLPYDLTWWRQLVHKRIISGDGRSGLQAD